MYSWLQKRRIYQATPSRAPRIASLTTLLQVCIVIHSATQTLCRIISERCMVSEAVTFTLLVRIEVLWFVTIFDLSTSPQEIRRPLQCSPDSALQASLGHFWNLLVEFICILCKRFWLSGYAAMQRRDHFVCINASIQASKRLFELMISQMKNSCQKMDSYHVSGKFNNTHSLFTRSPLTTEVSLNKARRVEFFFPKIYLFKGFTVKYHSQFDAEGRTFQLCFHQFR